MSKKNAKLENIRKRMADSKHKEGGSGDFWKPEGDTVNIIRILPEIGDMEMLWQERGTHYVPEGRTPLVCLSFTTDGAEDCPMCEYAQAAYDSGDTELAKKWNVRRAYLMNVIVRDKNAEGGFTGPKIYTPGVKVFQILHGIIADEDYGAIWDAGEGHDLKLTRDGAGINTTYTVIAKPKKTPLLGTVDNPDHEAIDELLSKARDHSKVLNSLPSYDELVEAAGLSAYFNESETGDDDDFEDEDY